MRLLTIALLTTAAMAADVRCLSAQDVRGLASAGFMSDVNDQRFPAFSGGVLVDLGRPWISAGAQGEVFVSWPYFAGRGALFGQGKLLTEGPVRPFVIGGVGFGESSGPMFGGGVEIGPRHGRVALRFTVEDYLARVGAIDCGQLGYRWSQCDAFPHDGQAYTAHQITLRIGIVF